MNDEVVSYKYSAGIPDLKTIEEFSLKPSRDNHISAKDEFHSDRIAH